MNCRNDQKFKNICRTCAKKSNRRMYDLKKYAQISEWLKENTSFGAAAKLEDLPSFICSKCFKQLSNYFIFKAQAIKSLETFIECLNNKQVNNESSYDQGIGDAEYIEQINTIELVPNAPTSGMATDDIFEAFFEILNDTSLDGSNDSDVETSANQNSTLLNNETNTKSKKTSFKCHICFKRFNKGETLAAHLRGHEGLKPFKCAQCECAYNHAYELRMHIRNLQ